MSKCNIGASCHFLKDGVDLENKKVPVILSDESEVVRYSWSDGKYIMTLKHGEDNVDLSRKDILSLFINHDTYELPIGKFENVRLEDGKLKAVAVFDADDDESMKIFNKLSKGFLQSFSVGVDIISKELTKEEDGLKYYDVTKWGLNEASVVGIPAIPNAKVGLEHESDKETLGVNPASAQIENQEKDHSMEYTKEKFEQAQADHAEALGKATAEATESATLAATTAERERVAGIMALNGDSETKLSAIKDGLSVGDAAIALNKVVETVKTGFEAAGEELNGNNEGEKPVEPETAEAKLAKEADEALDAHFDGGKK